MHSELTIIGGGLAGSEAAWQAAGCIPLRSFEQAIEQAVEAGVHRFFEGCLPIEIIAARGRESLAHGPLRPVGLADPRSGRRPHACVQLRQDNLVGFQTNPKFAEQKRVFALIPGLENARWALITPRHNVRQNASHPFPCHPPSRAYLEG